MTNPKSAGNTRISPVSGSEVLDDIAAYIRRYLVCDDHQFAILTLWSACIHCHNHFSTAPYLHIRSAVPCSGRTLCLNLLCDLSKAETCFTGILPAPLLDRLLYRRSLDLVRSRGDLPVVPVLIDDYHHSFGPSDRQPLVSLLATGAEKDAFFSRGEDDYYLFGPKAFAGNSPLPKSLAARCIPINLRRPKPAEKFVRYGWDDDAQPVEPLIDRLRGWLKQASSAFEQAVRNFPPDPPSALSPGQSKRAEPLIHIADVAGGAWPAKVRAALAAILNLAEPNPELQMLSDVRAIFHDKKNPEYLATSDLLSQLRRLDNRPWSVWSSNSGRRLAGHLRPFGIMSRRMHLNSEEDVMGYLFKDFHDAWECYLPQFIAGDELDVSAPSDSVANRAPLGGRLSAGVEPEPITLSNANTAHAATPISAAGAD